jgi:hypothetical protein
VSLRTSTVCRLMTNSIFGFTSTGSSAGVNSGLIPVANSEINSIHARHALEILVRTCVDPSENAFATSTCVGEG